MTPNASRYRSPRRLLVVSFGAYLLFVIYGSLVPLHFNPIGIEQPHAHFWRRWLRDWITPTVPTGPRTFFFVPLTFLAMANLASAGRRTSSVVVVLAAFGLSVAIEYLQTFFPPREVSPSDIFAETTGGILGVLFGSRPATG